MARWNEGEFVERAGRIARAHAVTKKPLNDLSAKVARDENLQPDEIRTLVRLANVATFQELFKNKDAKAGPCQVVRRNQTPDSCANNNYVENLRTPSHQT